jgi:hypothetical protein
MTEQQSIMTRREAFDKFNMLDISNILIFLGDVIDEAASYVDPISTVHYFALGKLLGFLGNRATECYQNAEDEKYHQEHGLIPTEEELNQ